MELKKNGLIAFSQGLHGFGLLLRKPGGPIIRLTRSNRLGPYPSYPAWSPNAKSIAFLNGPIRVADHRYEKGLELRLIDLRSRDVRRLGHFLAAGDPFSWSPDGRQIVFTDARGLSIVDVADGRTHPLYHGEGASSPNWSPDGRTIVFSRTYKTYGSELAAISPNGGGLRELVHSDSGNLFDNPHWSPDGHRLAFCARIGLRLVNRLEIMGANGKSRRTIAHCSPGSYASLSWSPDGRFIAFDAFQGIRIVPSHGGRSSSFRKYADNPSWGPASP